MAFRDENGKITIDEVAAQSDIKSLAVIKEHLQAALNYISQIERESADLSGNTATVISETAQQLQAQIKSMMSEIESTSENIDGTVRKYQLIDHNLKNAINGFEQ